MDVKTSLFEELVHMQDQVDNVQHELDRVIREEQRLGLIKKMKEVELNEASDDHDIAMK